VTITFSGAAGGVTGSKHVVASDGVRVLLDCGMWQGSREAEAKNQQLPWEAATIDQVVLSHAHIDHCGLLPLLVRSGFAGTIWATPATMAVAELMLTDMAKIQAQDAGWQARHNREATMMVAPLTAADIGAVMDRFRPVPYVRSGGGWVEIAAGVRLKLYDAGHILGSAISVLEFQEGGSTRSLVYSGDVGSRGTPLLHDPQMPLETIETLILESTYGSRRHEPFPQALVRLAQAVNAVCRRGGKMIVPAFSLGRTQALVYLLHKLTDVGSIPRFPIFVDSPLAVNLTDVYRAYRADFDVESEEDFEGPDHVPLAFRNLSYIRSVQESKQLNALPGPFMVISASGMMTAGRVVHHLRNTVEDERNGIFITGYQAAGTLGRRLVEGERVITLFGEPKQVRAEVLLFNEFSAHADAVELQQLAEQMRGLKRIFLVHGEPHQADDLAAQLRKAHPEWEVTRPEEGDVVRL